MKRVFSAGKLPPDFLERLFRKLPSEDVRVRIGPQVGEDAAVIDMGDRYLVAKTDPITFAADRIGRYLVTINANDVACLGADPKWLLVTCLLPEHGTDADRVEAIFEDLSSACSELGITLCGGHTEVTLGLDRPILVGQLLGEADKERFVDKRNMRPGDVFLLTKGIALEGTCVIARERAELLENKVPRGCLEKACGFLEDPGISVVRDARVALEAGGADIHGMHDPTEGGLVQGVRELATRGGVGVRIEWEAIPVYPETTILVEPFGIDPMGLIASGALLLGVAPPGEGKVREALEGAGIPCARIGRACSAEYGMRWVRGGLETPLPEFVSDELVKALAKGQGEPSRIRRIE
jgi:hydrogenase expression/formation protein HypE